MLNAAVETCFWPLYEVVDGTYRLTYRPEQPEPIESWLGLQKRFAHLLADENRELVAEIQRAGRRGLGRAPRALRGRRAAPLGGFRVTDVAVSRRRIVALDPDGKTADGAGHDRPAQPQADPDAQDSAG